MDSRYQAPFVPGARNYSGTVTPQKGADGILCPGGTNQAYIQNPWDRAKIGEPWSLH